MLRRVFFALFASSAVLADSAPDLGLTPEMLHGILREVAAKIEARHGSDRPEAEKLVERTLGFLAAAAMTLKEKRDVTAAAAMTLQLAALPGLPTRKLAAAGAAKIGDYDTALRLLDDCAKEKPGDLMILHQRIATLLRQSQSKATIKKATLLYGDITPDTVIEKTATLEKADRQTFLHTYLLHLLLKPETQTASELLTKLLDEQVLDKSTAGEVRKWMEK